MSVSVGLKEVYEKLKSSPHWRDDFKVVEVNEVGGVTVYYVEASDQEPATILSLAKLNEFLAN